MYLAFIYLSIWNAAGEEGDHLYVVSPINGVSSGTTAKCHRIRLSSFRSLGSSKACGYVEPNPGIGFGGTDRWGPFLRGGLIPKPRLASYRWVVTPPGGL